jgi:hypothetical protein
MKIPKDKRPSLLASGSLCSAVVAGKAGDLIRFLNEAQIPKDKRPLLLGSNSLYSVVVRGKGGDLIRFLTTHKFRMTSGRRSWRETACAAPWSEAKAVI